MKLSPIGLWRTLNSRLGAIQEQLATIEKDSTTRMEALHARLERLERAVGVDEPSSYPSARTGIVELQRRIDRIEQLPIQRLQRALGRIEHRQTAGSPFESGGFQVFSQDTEDGQLAWLGRLVPQGQRFFVEFGVETYAESNTRFLLMDHGWSGLVLDSDAESIQSLRLSEWHLAERLDAVEAFLTAEDVNETLARHLHGRDVGLVSIDVDGNDWWIWKALTVIDPPVVVIEYNAFFGPERAVAVPYDQSFDRRTAHPSWLYFGASLMAFEELGRRKGYTLVGVSSSGVNAFFVRDDAMTPGLTPRTARELWRPCRFSEYRDEHGAIRDVPDERVRAELLRLPLVEIDDRRP